jgi:DNA-binding transcriptional MerR regulator
MDKSPEAFRTISEVAEQLDVPAHVLRFWETRFAQVKPVKRGGGRRYYRPEDVRLLRGIRGLLYDDGMTIKGVQKILREQGVRHVIGLGTPGDGADPAPPPKGAPRPAVRAAPAPEPALATAGAPPADGAASAMDGHHAAAAMDGNRGAAAMEGNRGAATMEGNRGAATMDGNHPQADLFDGPEPAPLPEAALTTIDRDALRRLVGELEALRAAMVGARPA